MRIERLQKYLARCGLNSRRRCEDLISAGKVRVDGAIVTALGSKIDADRQTVEVDGERVRERRSVYIAANKPKGVVCSNSDPSGRPRLVEMIPLRDLRLFPIGRLDTESEGLILLTNDGDLAQRVAHPRFGVPKGYRVEVKGNPSLEQLEELRKGVRLPAGKTQGIEVRIGNRARDKTELFLSVQEGRNPNLRRALKEVGLPVKRLVRVSIGPVRLGSLKRGEWRNLLPDELQALRDGRAHVPPRDASTNRRKKRHRSQSMDS